MTLLLALAFAGNAPELDGDGFDKLVDCNDSDADTFPEADPDGFGDLADQTAARQAPTGHIADNSDCEGRRNPDVPLLECPGTPNTSENDQDCADDNAPLTDKSWGYHTVSPCSRAALQTPSLLLQRLPHRTRALTA